MTAPGFRWVDYQRSKDEAATAIINWITKVENEFDTKIVSFHSDSGGEFKTTSLQGKKLGIQWERTAAAAHG